MRKNLLLSVAVAAVFLSPEALAQRTDVWSFLFWQLGLKYRPVPGGSPARTKK